MFTRHSTSFRRSSTHGTTTPRLSGGWAKMASRRSNGRSTIRSCLYGHCDTRRMSKASKPPIRIVHIGSNGTGQRRSLSRMETAETARALRSLFRRAGNLAPDLATAVWFYVLLRRQSAAYRAAGRDHRRLEELFESTSNERLLELSGRELLDVRLTFGPVSASQKLTELLGFLRHAADRTPRRVCEIGTSAGGTLYALTRVAAPDAVIVSVDITIPQTVQTLR